VSDFGCLDEGRLGYVALTKSAAYVLKCVSKPFLCNINALAREVRVEYPVC
jgi:hypothetical protein